MNILSSVGRCFNVSQNSNNDCSINSISISRYSLIAAVAGTAITTFATAYFLNSLGVHGIVITTAVLAEVVLGVGLPFCYFYSCSKPEESDRSDALKKPLHEKEMPSLLKDNTINLGRDGHEIKILEPRIEPLQNEQPSKDLEKSSKTLDMLESELRSRFPIKLHSQTGADLVAYQLVVLLNSYAIEDIELLSQSEKFWVLITDPSYIATAVSALTPEFLEVLAKATLSGLSKQREVKLNALISSLNISDVCLEDKLMAIAKSGQPGIDEQKFAGKASRCKNKVEILIELKTNKERVLKMWQEEEDNRPVRIVRTLSSPSRRDSINKIASIPQIVRPEPRQWSTDELDNFIAEALSNKDDNNKCFNLFERMDDDSLRNFTLKLIDEKSLGHLWGFEKRVTNSGFSIEKRKHRLGIIFANLQEFQIKLSVKCEQFWEILCNTVDGYAYSVVKGFSANQFSVLISNMPHEKIGRLVELLKAFVVPDTESEKNILRQKVVALKEAFDSRKPSWDTVSWDDLKAVENTLQQKLMAL